MGGWDWINLVWPYLWRALGMVATGCGLPLPEEVFIIAGAVSAAAGDVDPWIMFGALLVGALLGDLAMYGIGNRLGTHWLRKHPRFSKLFHADQESRMDQLLQRHGVKVFLLARFMVGVRGPLYIAAGVARVPLRYFLIVDTFAATLVVGIVYALAYYVGDHVQQWIRQGEWAFTICVLVGIAVALLIYLRRRHEQGESQLEEYCDRTVALDRPAMDRPTADRPAMTGGSDAKPVPLPEPPPLPIPAAAHLASNNGDHAHLEAQPQPSTKSAAP